MQKNYLVLFITLFLTFISKAQEIKLSDYKKKYADEEYLEEVKPQFIVNIIDNRNYKENQLAIEDLNNYCNSFLELNANLDDQSILKEAKLKLAKTTINVSFLNYAESNIGELIIKSIVDININGGDFYNRNENFNLSSEKFTGIKFKHLKKEKHLKYIETITSDFIVNLSKNIIKKIQKKTNKIDSNIYKITSMGMTKKIVKTNKISLDDLKQEATINALINATEKAFGIHLLNISKMTDFGEISDVIEAKTSGKVMYYNVVENSEVLTTDGYMCLLIKSILKKNEN